MLDCAMFNETEAAMLQREVTSLDFGGPSTTEAAGNFKKSQHLLHSVQDGWFHCRDKFGGVFLQQWSQWSFNYADSESINLFQKTYIISLNELIESQLKLRR